MFLINTVSSIKLTRYALPIACHHQNVNLYQPEYMFPNENFLDFGLEEDAGSFDGTVHMAFSCKVNYDIRVFFLE